MLRAAGPTSRLGAALALAAALGAGVFLAACDTSPEDQLSVEEGQPVRLGELLYNVQITRFLNPSDPEDKAYLAGEPQPSASSLYLAVFLEVQNESDTAQKLPSDFTVTDTEGRKFTPLPSNSLFALKLGGRVAGAGELPEPESTAANGPIQGSMILFRIDQSATENRPLTLRIPSEPGATAEVELDI